MLQSSNPVQHSNLTRCEDKRTTRMETTRRPQLPRTFTRIAIVFAALLAGMLAEPLSALAQGTRHLEIGYIEDFALAANREVPLGQLIPGTDDYYYYHCLHLQNRQQFDKVDDLLKKWAARHKDAFRRVPRYREMRYRQSLLTYDRNPKETLDFIKDNLNLRFNHEPDRLNQPPQVPDVLDQDLIARKTLQERAYKTKANLDGFEDSALDWLIKDVPVNVRRSLLERLRRPDYKGLSKLIVADLQTKGSRGFGSLHIHNNLLLSQMDELLKLKPDLRSQSKFVSNYIARLAPSNDVNVQHQPDEYRAWLDRLWGFVKTLNASHNSLKAHVLHHRLVFDRKMNAMNRDRFVEYIKLPRRQSYMDSEYMRRADSVRYRCDFNQKYAEISLPPIGNDEPLIRQYLMHFFVKATNDRAFATWLNDNYLREVFAETKIVNGLGDPEQWYAMLSPAKYQALKERVDIEFEPTNAEFFAPDDKVSLKLHIKNVPTLIVKVFEINTLNFHRDNLTNVRTDINLDGLVANNEQTYEYSEPSLRRKERTFEFPQLNKRGTYVIDFIGNGKSSRAIVRKGHLRFLARTTPAGQSFRVYDETNSHVKTARIYLGGQQYDADDNGNVLVPFSTSPGRYAIVLADGDFSSLGHFNHESESYSLTTGFFVDRESLLRQRKAQVVIRPQLSLNGIPISLKALKDVELEIVSTAHDGIESKQKVSNFALFADRESTHSFSVPPRLSKIAFRLSAKVKHQTTSTDIDLFGADQFVINQIDKSDRITHAHLVRYHGGYAIELLGLTGEQRDARPVNVTLKHRDFKDSVTVALATNEAGLINLGPLTDITTVSVSGDTQGQSWSLTDDRHSQYSAVNAAQGDVVRIPVMNLSEPNADDVSLFEIRNSRYFTNRFDAINVKAGFLEIRELEPGDYRLDIRPDKQRIAIRITEGDKDSNFVLGNNRQLEQRGTAPVQIASVTPKKEAVEIRLVNASKFSRVHLFASRFVPAFDAYDRLSKPTDAEPLLQTAPLQHASSYMEGRNIGDEYRYILERRYATRFPGNMNARPGMILNPFVLRSTDTGDQAVIAGSDFDKDAQPNAAAATRAAKGKKKGESGGDFANLDFLAKASLVECNLVPDENGIITVKLDDIAPRQTLYVVAVDPVSTAVRSLDLPMLSAPRLDLRLASSLKQDTHFTQQKRFRFLPKGESVVIEKSSSARLETIDSLARLYGLYATLNPDQHLLDFAFVLGWPKLDAKEKRTLYSKYACHELSFFIKHKDPDFFDAVVRPHLANKMHKTFMDHWLLEDDLRLFLSPWSHARLNVAEQILLSDRIEGEAQRTSRLIAQRDDLLPTDITRLGVTLSTALAGKSLDTEAEALMLEIREEAAEFESGAIRYKESKMRGLKVENAPSAGFGMGGMGGGGGGFGGGAQSLNGAVAPDEDGLEPRYINERGQITRGRRRVSGRGGRASADDEAGAKLSEKRKSDLSDQLFDDSGIEGVTPKGLGDLGGEADYWMFGGVALGRQAALYRKLSKVQEWVENNYYKLPIESQLAGLITVNDFWRDYADRNRNKPFVSEHAAMATRNFSEMMLALAVTDLPFESPEHTTKTEDGRFTFTAGEDLIVVQDEIRPTDVAEEPSSILVSQNFFAKHDRYRHDGNKKMDKFVKDEFVINTVYGCQVAITNPTSSQQTLSLLLQVPAGAIPVADGQYTRGITVTLGPYSTQTQEYFFYFPADGKFPHYPVQVESDGKVIAFADALEFNVVEKATTIDRESWDYISQFASADQVLEFLKTQNLQRIDLSRIAWRMKDKAFFTTVTQLLHENHLFDNTLWSYAVLHNQPTRIAEYLAQNDGFVKQCGQQISCDLLVSNPIDRHVYQHRDYSPLVNARTHQLGAKRTILNDRYRQQYQAFMKLLTYQREFDDEQKMAITYYLLLQDRVDAAQKFFQQVDRNKVAAQIQYDYCQAYLDFFDEDPDQARAIVGRYADYPVDRWRNLFAAMKVQLDEIDGQGGPKTIDPENTQQANTQLAAADCSFDLEVDKTDVSVDYQNLETVQVNYYLMDVELLFSRNPFVQQYGRRFSNIRPNQSQEIALPKAKTSFTFELPDDLKNSNVLVEVVGRGMKKSIAYYSNSLSVQMVDNYGQVKVTDAKSGKSLPRVYVKAYARMNDGSVEFYKDGYTDLRGRFDYASLNTDDLDSVQKFAILVLSDTHGATVEETNPPKR